MGRSGAIKQPQLRPGALRDLNQQLHRLHKRAGCPTTRDIAKRLDGRFGHTTIHNAFSKPELPSFKVVSAIALQLADRVRDFGPGTDREESLDNIDRRIDRLWKEARYEEDARANQAEPPPLSDATRGLLHALSPECSVCEETRQLLDIVLMEDPDPTRWPPGFRKTGEQPEAPDPWRLIRLCRRCQRNHQEGELTEQQLRAARAALDRRPGAARHYAAYLDQILLGAEPAIDARVAALSVAIVRADPRLATNPYALNHGRIQVDRAHGSLSWGQYECTDDH
ncbi:hypothetical protein [Streptomyces sp. NPDC050528]|uniref:hypothetical protein n=1 Tax=Streptomyces sp. NPDC050528 TaxID=3365623 RepID=UPI00379863B3